MLTCKTLLLALSLAAAALAATPRVEFLWPGGAPDYRSWRDGFRRGLSAELPTVKYLQAV